MNDNFNISDEIIRVSPDKLVPSPDNPRAKAQPDAGLVASVREFGVLEPLIIEPTEDKHVWRIVAGERRWKAAKKTEQRDVPCRVATLGAQERQLFMLIENLHREDLSPVEEARGYAQAVEHGMTKAELANKLGRTQKLITERLRLIVLPPNAQAAVEKGDLRLADAVSLAEAIEAQPELAGDVEAAGVLGGDAVRSITHAAEQRVRQEAVAALRDELAQQGRTLIERDGSRNLPAGTAFVDHRSYGDREIDVDPKEHQSQPCAAWLVEWSGHGKEARAKAFQVCAEVRRHNEKGDSGLKKRSGVGSPTENDKRAKARESARRNDELRVERRGQIANALASAKRNELLDYLIGSAASVVAADHVHIDFKERVATALGIILPVVEAPSGGVQIETSALVTYGEQSEINRLRLATAVLVVRMEEKAEDGSLYGLEHQAHVHFPWLIERGVVVGDEEVVRTLRWLAIVEDGPDDGRELCGDEGPAYDDLDEAV